MPVRFDGFEIDFDRIEIRRDGRLVDVQPQVFAVLEYLFRNRDRVVPKEELLDNVWSDRFVSESALTTRIKLARRAVGDDGSSQSVIRTVHGRGYHFVATPLGGADTIAARMGDEGIRPLIVDDAAAEPAPASSPDRQASPPTDNASGSSIGIASGVRWPFVGRHDVLDQIDAHLAGGVGAVLIDGPSGSGRSQLVERWATRHDGPLLRINGNPTTRHIPLAGLVHVLDGTEVVDADRSETSMFRLGYDAVFRHFRADARSAPSPDVDEPPAVIAVDDVHLVDDLTGAVIGAAVTGGLAKAVLTRRTPLSGDPSGLSASGVSQSVQLGPLDEIDMEVALYRALPGPIDDSSARVLLDAAGGSPALLRDMVETSYSIGTLANHDGLWSLVARPTTSRSEDWPPENLSVAGLEAARRLALLPRQPLERTAELVGEEALEELDAAGLLAVTEVDDEVFVQLAHAILEEVVVDSMSPLLLRRVRRELLSGFGDDVDPHTMARLLSWPGGASYGDDTVLSAAARALLSGDLPTAEQLAGHLDPHTTPAVDALSLEVACQRGQWATAERIAQRIDVAELDDRSAALVVRRRATIRFDVHHEHQAAIDELAEVAARRAGPVSSAALARRVALLATDERVDETFAAIDELPEMSKLGELEVVLARASADVQRGRVASGLAGCVEAARLVEHVPVGWQTEVWDLLRTVECEAHFVAGDIDATVRMIRDHLPPGRLTGYVRLPALVADTALMAGRVQLVRELVRPILSESRSRVSPLHKTICEGILARMELREGNPKRATRILPDIERAWPVAAGLMRTRLAISWAHLADWHGRGREAVDALLELADLASARGSLVSEMLILAEAMRIDRKRSTAQAVSDRVAALADAMEGRLWPVVAEEARVRAVDGDLQPVAAAYEDLGFVIVATNAIAG